MSDDRHDRVSRRAYELWEQEGGGHGRDEEHWLRAARELEETVAAPDGTTMTIPSPRVGPVRKRAAPKPAAAAKSSAAAPTPAKAPTKPRKPKSR